MTYPLGHESLQKKRRSETGASVGIAKLNNRQFSSRGKREKKPLNCQLKITQNRNSVCVAGSEVSILGRGTVVTDANEAGESDQRSLVLFSFGFVVLFSGFGCFISLFLF